ncbi:hypothetical protein KC678_02490 [Candidatus Dojkabacteria bacterium]|uniref:Probable pectate lyase C n=1 Tax=Candidatus Dojkabacteria bacterium TaxID=2099670 RepID=A0A955L1C3_9BACT|nr:hypothetical protein [Candidatus Dojkabacteria bacterium]
MFNKFKHPCTYLLILILGTLLVIGVSIVTKSNDNTNVLSVSDTTNAYGCGTMDNNSDSTINLGDFAVFVKVYGSQCSLSAKPTTIPSCGYIDGNENGKVDLPDFALFSQLYLNSNCTTSGESFGGSTGGSNGGSQTQPEVQYNNAWYVSKNGNNGDGTSWTNAWNELNQIDWNSVEPGDVVYIDGGTTSCAYPTLVTGITAQPKTSQNGSCGMQYTTTLNPAKNGTSTDPITIKLSTESGRDGTAVVFGGRNTPLPYCSQSGYSDSVQNRTAFDLQSQSYIVVDGSKWSGIKLYGWLFGVELNSSANNLTFKHLEIFDNGNPIPDQKGVELSGTNITFERSIIHDNGQDAFQSGGGISNFTLKQSWLFNQRRSDISATDVFNGCRHSDGIQVYSGGSQYGLLVEDSIIGPGFLQGLILGDYTSSGAQYINYGDVHDVTIRNSLLISYDGPNFNANLYTKYDSGVAYPNNPPTNYEFDHVTTYVNPGRDNWNIYLLGSGHNIHDSIFYGGGARQLTFGSNPTFSNNVRYNVQDYGGVTTNSDPNFVDSSYWDAPEDYADFDFTSQTYSSTDKGTCVVSPAVLFSLDPGQHCP